MKQTAPIRTGTLTSTQTSPAPTAARSSCRNQAQGILLLLVALAVVLAPSTALGVRLQRLADENDSAPGSAMPAESGETTDSTAAGSAPALTPTPPLAPQPPLPRSDRAAWSRLMRESRENLRLGQTEEAEQTLLAALAIGDHHGPPDQRARTTLFYLEKIAGDYYNRGLYAQHAGLVSQYLPVAVAVHGTADPSLTAQRLALTQSYEETGEFQSARSILDALLDESASSKPLERADLLSRRAAIGLRAAQAGGTDEDAEVRLQNLAAAEADLTETLTLLDAESGADPLRRVAALQLKANVVSEQERADEAETLLLEALAVAELNSPGSAAEAAIQGDLARYYKQENRNRDALAHAQTAADQLAELDAPPSLQAAALDSLTSILIALDRDTEAEAAFQRGFALAEEDPDAARSLKDRYAKWKNQADKEPQPQEEKKPAALPSTPPDPSPAQTSPPSPEP